MKIKKSEEN